MEEVYTESTRRNIATVRGHAIQKVLFPTNIKTTMIYVDVAKPHIQEQVEKLNRIPLPPLSPKVVMAFPPTPGQECIELYIQFHPPTSRRSCTPMPRRCRRFSGRPCETPLRQPR